MKKYFKTISAVAVAAAMFLSSCSKDDNDDPGSGESTVEIKMVNSLDATSKVYFNLLTGETVSGDLVESEEWHISFYGEARSVNICTNSAEEGPGNTLVQLMETGFDDLSEAPGSGYVTGAEAMPDFTSWANYTGSTSSPQHAVLPKPGLTIVVKTGDGQYAKLQVISLYEGNPNTTTEEFSNLETRPAFGYFTFRYALQNDGTRKLK